MRPALAVMLVAGISIGRATPRLIEVGGVNVVQRGGVWRLDGRPFTGLLIDREQPGAMRMAVHLVDGLPDGREWRWYGSGALESVRHYAGGRKVGFHRGWWPDGTRRFEGDYRADGFHGRYRAWYTNGRLADLRTFADGREAGLQQSWTVDGVLFLNYEVRNGRRYGSVNAKPCIPTGKVKS
jgi:antitoxin component YwqK of YwqJK toxin-antitoxin module